MNPHQISLISRRQFLASAGLPAAPISLTSRNAVAEEESPVTVIRASAKTA